MNYYGVIRSTDHLAHYGVKGMRWGVRRAIVTGNQRALDRHYRKAARKLAKLQNIGDNAYKSIAKSAAYGTAAAGTGALALGGTGLAAKGMRYGAAGLRTLHTRFGKKKNGAVAGALSVAGGSKRFQRIDKAAQALEDWGKGTTNININKLVVDPKTGQLVKKGALGKDGAGINIGNNKIFRVGAALATAGLAAKSAQHAYRAKNSEKYREKAERFRDEMDNAFAGTEYEGSYAKMSKRQQRRRRGY